MVYVNTNKKIQRGRKDNWIIWMDDGKTESDAANKKKWTDGRT